MTRNQIIAVVAGGAILAVPSLAFAQAAQGTSQSLGTFDKYLSVFVTGADLGMTYGQKYLAYTTYFLLVMNIVLLGYDYMVDNGEEDIVVPILMRTLTIGIVTYLLNDWSVLANQIHEGFVKLGLLGTAGGFTASQLFSPSAIAQQGINLVYVLNAQHNGGTSFWDQFKSLFYPDIVFFLIAECVIVASFIGLSIVIIFRTVKFKMAALFGSFLFPFTLFRYTAFIGEAVPGKIVGAAVEMGALAFIVGLSLPVFSALTPANEFLNMTGALALSGAAVSILVLAITVPPTIGAMVTGGPNFAGRR